MRKGLLEPKTHLPMSNLFKRMWVGERVIHSRWHFSGKLNINSHFAEINKPFLSGET